MTDIEMLKIAVEALDKKKAQDINALKIDNLTILANYFVIATGGSTTQVKALADEVDFQLSQKGIEPRRTEGYQSSNWIILDYTDVVVHVFLGETREFYQLEKLWGDAEKVDISDYLIK